MKRAMLLLVMIFLLCGVPDVRHLQLTMSDRESDFPSLAWTGSRLGAAWMDGRDGNMEIYFRTAAVNTSSLGPEMRITSSDTFDDHPRLCWTGSEFGLSWIHEQKTKFNLMFQRLSAEGRPVGGSRAVVSQSMLGKQTAVCWTGGGYGLASTEFIGDAAAGNIVFRFLDEEGKTVGEPVAVTSGPGRKVPAEMLRSGSDLMLFYLDSDRDLAFMIMLDPFGRPRGEPVLLNKPGTRADAPAAASNGSLVAASWPQAAGENKDIMVSVISTGGRDIGEPYPVTAPEADRASVAVAAGPNGFGLSWIEINSEGRMPYFRTLDAQAKPVGQPIRLSKPRPSKVMSNQVAMVTDNLGYVIAWVDVAPPINTEVILSRVGF